MEFTAECGCRIEYPEMSLISNIGCVENFNPRTVYVCEKHKISLLTEYLESFDTITFAQIRRTFRLPESEVISLIHKMERENPDNIRVTVHDYTVTRIS